MEHFGKMRVAVMSTGTVRADLSEIILTMQFAVLGHEFPFKIHARRTIDHGVTKESLRAMLMTGLGVTLVACEVARALSWLDEVCSEAIKS
ncbi:hypothetical protein OKW40_001787 [Paraburkholderia sp. RAU6.4a]|uniref:hypothetical protein n=1 Tax=Paraburkholderia sp. RAU6.4a TaxID=2991067 RepID=UPI003D258AA3